MGPNQTANRSSPAAAGDLHAIEGHLVVRFECATDGFVGFNLVGTKVHCRSCGRPVFASIADAIFAATDDIKSLS